MNMAWNVQFDPQTGGMALAGDLTIFSVLDIRDRLNEAFEAADSVAVDLGGVTEIDTAGLQLMLLAKRKAGKNVLFRNHSDAVLHLLGLANLEHALDISPLPAQSGMESS
jgi:anti-sigma B factor antagonist